MNSVQKYYNDFYKNLSVLDENGNDFSKIKEFLPNLPKGSKIIDIGCGHGSVSEDLLKQGFCVCGMEINQDAIKSLKNKGFNVIEHDIEQPFNLTTKFDLVLLLDVLEHVFDPLGLLAEAEKITKEGGNIIITIPLYFDLIDRVRILFTGSIITRLCHIKRQIATKRHHHIIITLIRKSASIATVTV